MISIRPNRELDPVIQDECVRRMVVLCVRTGVHFRRGSQDHVGRNRPPSEGESIELADFARTASLFGKFDVVTERVLVYTVSPGGVDDFMERTEFHLFRRRDVPYLMSLKTALEVMGT